MAQNKKGGDSDKFLQGKLNSKKYVNKQPSANKVEQSNTAFFALQSTKIQPAALKNPVDDLNLQVHGIKATCL